ncbi:hypothetical protein AAIO99_13595, partial [Streptomyces sp. AC154]
MTPLPGAPRGDARPRDRPDTPAHLRREAPLRQYLAALLLAVLTITATITATVAGGAFAAGAGPSARTTAGPASPVGHPAGTRLAGKDLLRSSTTAIPRAVPGPGSGSSTGTEPRSRTRAAFEGLRPAPVTAPQPWAAAEHPRTPQH